MLRISLPFAILQLLLTTAHTTASLGGDVAKEEATTSLGSISGRVDEEHFLKQTGYNCFSGHGGVNQLPGYGLGSRDPGWRGVLPSPRSCASVCKQTPGCNAFVFMNKGGRQPPGTGCWLRAGVDISKCELNKSPGQFDTYVRSDGNATTSVTTSNTRHQGTDFPTTVGPSTASPVPLPEIPGSQSCSPECFAPYCQSGIPANGGLPLIKTLAEQIVCAGFCSFKDVNGVRTCGSSTAYQTGNFVSCVYCGLLR
jgi:hypothetical protein